MYGQSTKQETVVEINEWVPGESGTVLATYALVPCIGLAIHDRRIRFGHMGHWVAPEEKPESVDSMIQSALQTATPPHQLQAWQRGAAADPNDQEYVASIAISRAFVTDRLVTAGIINCHTRWSEQPLSVDMWLNCASGGFISVARLASFE